MSKVPKRVLIVDDDADFGDYVREVMEDVGCVATHLRHSRRFREVFESFDPDVVVLDVTMPDVDGIELVSWLADRGCKAKIVIASGYNPIFSAAAQQLGELRGLARPAILQKPVEPAVLRALVA